LSDAHGRDLLRCQAAARPDEAHERPVFETAFGEYGLPQAIRSDNGLPIAAPGAGGFSRLAIWWIKLSIGAERSSAGKPQQNGRHERLHGTLKEAPAAPPAASLGGQQARSDAFPAEYNTQRPHEALGRRLRVPPACRRRWSWSSRQARGCGRDAWQFSDQEVRGAAP